MGARLAVSDRECETTHLRKGLPMRLTYDSKVDAAYMQLADLIDVGGVEFTYACDPREVDGMIHLDFDADGRLVGLEVLGARSKLPAEFLARAEPLGTQQ